MLGLDCARDLSPARAASLCEYINNRVKEGWDFDWFPEWTVRERRSFRPVWSATANYTAGKQVLFYAPNYPVYVQALQASLNQPPTDAAGNLNLAYWALLANDYTGPAWQPNTQYALGQQALDSTSGKYYQCFAPHVSGAGMDYTKFGLLKPFDKFVGYNQTWPASVGELTALGLPTPLGRVKTLSVRDPFIATRNPGYIPFRMSQLGVQVNMEAPPLVWVQFALAAPVFTTQPWNAGTNYTGQLETVYVGAASTAAPTGNCYQSIAPGAGLNPAVSPASWQIVNFPAALSNFVKRAALCDALRDLKQTDRAQIEENRAYEELSNAVDREIQSQGGSERAAVETYGSGGPGEGAFSY